MSTPALLWGAYTKTQDMAAVEAFEAAVGKRMSLAHPAVPWASGFTSDGKPAYVAAPVDLLQKHWTAGRICLLDWGSQNIANLADPGLKPATILAGTHDAYIHQFARDLAAWGHDLILRFDGEMQGTWQYWFTDGPTYVALWRYVRAIFVQEGATNVSWNWCCNVLSPAGARFDTAADKVAAWYPGDDQLEFTGFDSYNWSLGTNDQAGGWVTPWMTFDQIMRGFAGWLGDTYGTLTRLAPTKRMILGEFASDSRGGSKSAWITDAFARIRTAYPALMAVSWFDAGPQWALTAAADIAAFSAAIGRPEYLPGGPDLILPRDKQPIPPYVLSAAPSGSPDAPSAIMTVLQAQADTLRQQLATAQLTDAANKQAIADLTARLAAIQANLQGLFKAAGITTTTAG